MLIETLLINKLINKSKEGFYATTPSHKNKDFPELKEPTIISKKQQVLLGILNVILSIICAYLAWKCNKDTGVVLKVFITIFAAIFSGFYILFYFIYRVILGVSCGKVAKGK
tara:strand:+ start:256 stop:591 length:336 start_codon:yes stop_codon:yes gene_type:complete